MDSPQETKEPLKKSYTLYKYRFVVWLCFAVAGVPNLGMWNLLYPLQTTLTRAYQLSFTMINYGTSVVQNFTYIPGTFMANYFFDTLGIRSGVICASLLTLAGYWVRSFGNLSFYYIF